MTEKHFEAVTKRIVDRIINSIKTGVEQARDKKYAKERYQSLATLLLSSPNDDLSRQLIEDFENSHKLGKSFNVIIENAISTCKEFDENKTNDINKNAVENNNIFHRLARIPYEILTVGKKEKPNLQKTNQLTFSSPFLKDGNFTRRNIFKFFVAYNISQKMLEYYFIDNKDNLTPETIEKLRKKLPEDVISKLEQKNHFEALSLNEKTKSKGKQLTIAELVILFQLLDSQYKFNKNQDNIGLDKFIASVTGRDLSNIKTTSRKYRNSENGYIHTEFKTSLVNYQNIRDTIKDIQNQDLLVIIDSRIHDLQKKINNSK